MSPGRPRPPEPDDGRVLRSLMRWALEIDCRLARVAGKRRARCAIGNRTGRRAAGPVPDHGRPAGREGRCSPGRGLAGKGLGEGLGSRVEVFVRDRTLHALIPAGGTGWISATVRASNAYVLMPLARPRGRGRHNTGPSASSARRYPFAPDQDAPAGRPPHGQPIDSPTIRWHPSGADPSASLTRRYGGRGERWELPPPAPHGGTLARGGRTPAGGPCRQLQWGPRSRSSPARGQARPRNRRREAARVGAAGPRG